MKEGDKCPLMGEWGYRVSGVRGWEEGAEVSKLLKNRSFDQHPSTLLSLLFPPTSPPYLPYEVVERIKEVVRWGERQRRYSIQSSSLLIAIDREEMVSPKVKMIDFAHTFPSCPCSSPHTCNIWSSQWIEGCQLLCEDILEIGEANKIMNQNSHF